MTAAQHLCGESLRRGNRLQSRQLLLEGSQYCVQRLLHVPWYLHCSSINPCLSFAYAPVLMGPSCEAVTPSHARAAGAQALEQGKRSKERQMSVVRSAL